MNWPVFSFINNDKNNQQTCLSVSGTGDQDLSISCPGKIYLNTKTMPKTNLTGRNYNQYDWRTPDHCTKWPWRSSTPPTPPPSTLSASLPGSWEPNPSVWIRALLANQILEGFWPWLIPQSPKPHQSCLHVPVCLPLPMMEQRADFWRCLYVDDYFSHLHAYHCVCDHVSGAMSATSSATIGFWKHIQHLKNENRFHEKMPEMKVKVPQTGQGQK